MKLVSVIIPAHNEENSIAKVIQALLAQEYSPLEIIVVDNASTDRTSEVAGAFPITVLHESQKGTNFALECGRRVAKGEVIARLDADCLPDPKWVLRGVRHFDDPEVSAVTGPYDYFDASKWFQFWSLFIQKTLYFFTNWILQLVSIGAVMTGGDSMMRSEDLEHIGGFNTSILFYGDDTNIGKRLSKVGRVVFDNGFIVKTSARRFKTHGSMKILWLYFFYFIKETLRPVKVPKKIAKQQ